MYKKVSLVLRTSIAPMSRDHSECNLVSIPLRNTDPTSGEHILRVSSSEILLGALLKLSKTRVCEKSCGHHLIHRVV